MVMGDLSLPERCHQSILALRLTGIMYDMELRVG